jgi:hypothetical protein
MGRYVAAQQLLGWILRRVLRWAPGDDQGGDFEVCTLRDDTAVHELVLGCVGAAGDDALCVGASHAGERLELVEAGSVDVQHVSGGLGGVGGCLRGGGVRGEGNERHAECEVWKETARVAQGDLLAYRYVTNSRCG